MEIKKTNRLTTTIENLLFITVPHLFLLFCREAYLLMGFLFSAFLPSFRAGIIPASIEFIQLSILIWNNS